MLFYTYPPILLQLLKILYMLEAVILLENLKNGLSFVNHAISQRAQLPILLNFLIDGNKNGLFICATDLEIGIRIKIPAKVNKNGRIAVSAKTFLDLVTSITQEKVTISEKENNINLTTEKVKASFAKTPTDEFPSLYQEKGSKVAEFDKEEFKKETAKVVFSASLDIGRPALSGVYFEKQEADVGINLVAADGFRLSLRQGFAKKASSKKEPLKLIIPSRVIKEVLGVKEEDQKITLFTSSKSNQVVFGVGDTEVVGRLIESDYPDYKKIIPDDFDTKVYFDKPEAEDAVRSCLVFAREAANIIKLSIGNGKLKFSASSPQLGENEVEVDAKIEGEENEIAFNGRYLLDFLGAMESEDISFEMTGPLNPGVFRIPKEDNFLHIIMPIRIQE